MSRSFEIMEKLKQNVSEIDSAEDTLGNLLSAPIDSDEQADQLEELYKKIFTLAMDNSGLYEDLMEALESEEDFTRRRLSDEASKLLRVEIVTV